MARLISRICAVLFVVPATYYFIYWLPFSLIPADHHRWVAILGSLLCALGAGWFVWIKLATPHNGVISSIFLGACLVGGIGFTAGFFGPIIFTPVANQGPLLGIFFTGPIGFLLGGIGGLLYWAVRGRTTTANDNA